MPTPDGTADMVLGIAHRPGMLIVQFYRGRYIA